MKKEIEKLKQENKQLTISYDMLNKKYCEECDKNINLADQLQQTQNQKAIELLEEIFKLFDFYENSEGEDFVTPKEGGISFVNYLEDKLNKLKGAKTK